MKLVLIVAALVLGLLAFVLDLANGAIGTLSYGFAGLGVGSLAVASLIGG